MASTPQTVFQLFRAPFDPSHRNVTDFANEAARAAYFATLPATQLYTAAQYIRRDRPYRVPIPFDSVEEYNYIVYNNGEGLGNEYAFVTKKTFIDFNTTELELVHDFWQNNHFNYSISQAFVERRHKNRYTASGKPIFYRGAEFPYKAQKAELVEEVFETMTGSDSKEHNVVFVGIVINEINCNTTKNQYGQTIFVGYIPVAIDGCTQITFTLNSQTISTLAVLPHIAADPRVLCVFMTPYPPFDVHTDTLSVIKVEGLVDKWKEDDPAATQDIYVIAGYSLQQDNVNETVYTVDGLDVGTVTLGNIDATQPRSMTYEPRLLEEPYTFFRVDNGNGTIDFGIPDLGGEDEITITAQMSGGVNGANVCLNVGGLYTDLNCGFHKMLTANCPQLALRTDAYLSYMANNRASMNGGLAMNIGLTAAGIALTAASGGTATPLLASTALSMAANVGQSLLNREDLKKSPDGIRGVGQDMLAEFSNGYYGGVARLWKYTLYDRDKAQLFDYYTKFGYQVNSVEPVTIRTRTYYDYIKTKDCIVNGVGDTEDQLALQAMFDSGVTFWHCNGTSVLAYGNYALENKELSFS